jgi:ribosomal protein S14
MELWLWVIGVVVGFILFSGLFSRYRRDGKESGPLTDGAPPAGDNGSHDEGNPRPDLPPEDGHGHAVFSGASGEMAAQTVDEPMVDDGRRCRRCGASNEVNPAFTYCRECVQRLM